jgi:hypothetical protein
MDDHQREFDTRIRRIDRRHKKLASGFVTNVSADGLIVAVPRRRRVRVPFLGLAVLVLGIVAFKGLVHANLGEGNYNARVSALAEGTQVERLGAWVMQADPLTLWVSDQAATLLR